MQIDRQIDGKEANRIFLQLFFPNAPTRGSRLTQSLLIYIIGCVPGTLPALMKVAIRRMRDVAVLIYDELRRITSSKAVPLQAMEEHGGERRYSSYSYLTSAHRWG
jgi:hypothetical protein